MNDNCKPASANQQHNAATTLQYYLFSSLPDERRYPACLVLFKIWHLDPQGKTGLGI